MADGGAVGFVTDGTGGVVEAGGTGGASAPTGVSAGGSTSASSTGDASRRRARAAAARSTPPAAVPSTQSRTSRSVDRSGGRAGRASAPVGGRSPARLPGRSGARAVRLPEVVLGVMLVAGCALVAVIWQQHADSTTTIVVAGRSIQRGTVISADDLRGAEIGGETAGMVSGEDALTLLGRVAVVDIDADVPMTRSLLTDAQSLGADEALTSVALAPGRLPPDLAAGDNVRIVITADGGPSLEPVTSLIDEPAVVWSVDAAPDGVDTVVTVRGPISLAARLTSAAVVQLVRVVGG